MTAPAIFSYAVLRWLTVVLCAATIFLLSFTIVAHPANWFHRTFARYTADIERKLYRLFIWTPGYRIAGAQLTAVLAILAIRLLLSFPPVVLLALIFMVAVGPELWLLRELQKRTMALDRQVDGFMVALANALKSRPSIADAIVSVPGVLNNPIRQEVELVAKQMRVGSSLDQAILSMAGRVGSRQLDAAVSAILVGRQVGGNVPHILETTAATMREMARLEGVVRTKTAEGKAQIWVLAAFPFVLILLFSLASPGYFDPLSETTAGYVCTLVGFALWGASVVSARRILRVDI